MKMEDVGASLKRGEVIHLEDEEAGPSRIIREHENGMKE